MRKREPNSVSGVKMLVAGGSTASVVFSAALRTGSGARARCRVARRTGRACRRRRTAARRTTACRSRVPREKPQEVGASARGRKGAAQRRNQHFALAGGDHVGKQRQRLGVDERHGAADDDERMALGAFGGTSRDAGEPQQREHVHVVPLEGHRERDHVEVTDRRLRLEREERRPGRDQLGELLFRRQEDALADDVVLGVEEAVHRLKAEVRHPDPVGVRERERDAQTIAVRLSDVADFFREGCECAFALFPGLHGQVVQGR